MIGAVMKTNGKDNKTSCALALSGSLQTFLEESAEKNNLSKSEIAEFLIRKGAGLSTDNSRNILNEIFKNHNPI